MGNPATGCTCGSGGHPRPCALHPWAMRVHCAELSVFGQFNGLEGEELKDACDAVEELMEATRAARKAVVAAERERCAAAVEAEIAPENDPEANDCLRDALDKIREVPP